MMDFTVAIRTYNGEKTLSKLLDELQEQIEIENINWEIIIIDNNSTDNTANIIKEYQSNWNKPYPLKYFFEPKQGRAFARHTAVKKAQSELIGFLDDDNLPSSNWVKQAYIFGKQHPKAGAYGGQINGLFEVEPPAGFERIARYFALIKGDQSYCYNERYSHSRKKMFPPGAGIVIRKQAWLESVPENPQLIQTAEDIEFLSYLWKANWEIWYNSEMGIDHLIGADRFSQDYLVNFFRHNGLTRHSVRMLNYATWQKPLMTLIYFFNDLLKLIRYMIKNRNITNEDMLVFSEFQFFIYVLLSPFYTFGKRQFYI